MQVVLFNGHKMMADDDSVHTAQCEET